MSVLDPAARSLLRTTKTLENPPVVVRGRVVPKKVAPVDAKAAPQAILPTPAASRVTQTGLGLGVQGVQFQRADPLSQGVPPPEEWPNAIYRTADGTPEAITILERHPGHVRARTTLGEEIKVAASQLLPLQASREVVARGFSIEGSVLGDQLPLGLLVGRGEHAGQAYEVIFDLERQGFTTMPAGLYRPYEAGASAARADAQHQVQWPKLLKKIGEHGRDQLDKLFAGSKTPEEHLLLSRVFLASDGNVAAVRKFQEELRETAGLFHDDGRYLLRLGTVDGLTDVLGQACVLTALEYQHIQIDPREALRVLRLGAPGLLEEQQRRLQEAQRPGAAGVQVDRALAELNRVLGPKVQDRFELVAWDGRAASRPVLLQHLAAHFQGRPAPAPEGVQLYLRGHGAAGHAVTVVGARQQFDLAGRGHWTFEVRDPALLRSYELSERDLSSLHPMGFAARASVLERLGVAPSASTITRPMAATKAQVGLDAELVAVERLAAKGHWPEANAVLEQRLEVAGRDDLLERLYEAQNQAWGAQYELLKTLAQKGQWNELAAENHRNAAYMLGRPDLTSSLKGELKGRAELAVTLAAGAKEQAKMDRNLAAQTKALSILTDLDAALKTVTDRVFAEVGLGANRALALDGSQDFQELTRRELQSLWPKLQKEINGLLNGAKRQSKLNDDAIAARRSAGTDFELWASKVATILPDLTHGEAFSTPAMTTFEFSGPDEAARVERRQLIEGMVRYEPPADERDAHLLTMILDSVEISLLRELKRAGYRIGVARGQLTTVEKDLGGIDHADGIHYHPPGRSPSITVRSYFDEGVLHVNPGPLFHEIGHAIDQVLRAQDGKALYLDDRLVNAFKAEHQALPAYFHSQPEFIAEATRRYLLDRDRARRELPLTTQVLDQMGFDRMIPDRQRLLQVQDLMQAPAIVNVVSGDPIKEVSNLEKVNRARAQKRAQPAPYIIEVVGDADRGGPALARRLAETMRRERSPDRVDFDGDEALLKITPQIFNDPQKLEGLLRSANNSGTGSLLYFSDITGIDRSDEGFKILAKYFERFGGVTPILFEGSSGDLDRLQKVLPTMVRKRCSLGALSPAQIAKTIEGKALDEGYNLSDEARVAFEAKAKDGGLETAYELWQKVKTTQARRLSDEARHLPQDPGAAMLVLGRDVERTKLPPPADPLQRLDRMVGQHKLKTELRMAIEYIKVAAADEKLGVSGERPRQNLLIGGNQGTGKTTMADLFIEALAQKGVLANKRAPARLTVADLVGTGKPEENVRKLFEDYKDSAIRIDEFHTLADTDAGKVALKAMIPYLEDPAYAGTVFVGCGYTPKLKALFAIDPGLERRFGEIRTAVDYSREELGQIFDNMLVDRDRTVTPEGRRAALDRLERERRRMRFFGNAGTVDTILKEAEKKRIARLAAPGLGELSASERRALLPEDFAAPPVVSVAEVWKELDAIKGNAELKEKLRTIADSIEFARRVGLDPLESFEPYIFLDGGPGTGKSTLGPVLARFFAAYDIIPTADFQMVGGPSLQGKYVGHTPDKVEKLFESAWGGTLLLDEVSGIAKAGGGFKDEFVKTILPILENNRGKFVLLAADYASGKKLFYAMDAGLSRRFGMSITLQPLDGALASEKIAEELGKAKFRLSPEIRLEELLAELVSLPNYASGGDVRTLVGRIREQHGSAFLRRERAGEKGLDPFHILPEAVERAVQSLVAEKRAELPASNEAPPPNEEHLYDTQTLSKTAPVKATAISKLDPRHAEVLKALGETDRQFAAAFNTDPAAQARAQKDPQSAYLKSLAAKLGVKPAEAMKALSEAKQAAVKLVTVERLVKRFQYHCPYCGGIDSGGCAYRDMPLEWKIEHSLKKPWDEVEKTTMEAKA